MSMAEPSLMKSFTFKARTTSLGTIKRSNLAALDTALAKMDFTPFASKQDKIRWLKAIIAECINWKANKAHKLVQGTANYSQNTADRAVVVDQVGDEAWMLLKYYTFENQKAHRLGEVPQAAANRRGLQHGHDKEQGLYLAGKATAVNAGTAIPVNFPGGSLVNANMAVPVGNFGALPPPVAAILNGGTKFHQLSQLEFDTLADFFDTTNLSMQQPVHYSRKEERINDHMLVVINGRLRKELDQNYTTPLDMWAMDKYGNFMCTAAGTQVQVQGVWHQYNHSSLNAGNDVLCAGTVIITNGEIMEIDNNSGHYQPSRQNLHTAVRVLHHDLGVMFDNNCIVRNYAPPQRRYVNWLAFDGNVNAPGTPNFP
jgi:hypothetical protein